MYQRTITIKFNNKPYKIIPINADNMVDAFKLRITSIGYWIFNDYQLKDWKFEFNPNLPIMCIAQCSNNDRTIYINTLNLYLLDWQTVKYVLLHEIAHALTPDDHNHGKQWQDKCKELGIPPTVKLNHQLKRVGEDQYQMITITP